MMRLRVGLRVVLASVAGCIPALVVAQPSVNTLPASLRGPDLNARAYQRSSGLAAGTVYRVTRDPSGRMWLGAEDGAYVSAGGQWHRESMPRTNISWQVRDVLFDSSGARWYGMRSGAYRLANGEWTHYGPAQGVPGNVVYSIAETRAVDGKLRVVLGSVNGVCVVDGARCRALTIPDSIGQTAFMMRSAVAADGRDELWIVSAEGGAARMRDGKWTGFGVAQGLNTTSAEDLALANTASGLAVYVVGLGGVFVLSRSPSGVERFVSLPGSPSSAYRVAWVPRADRAAEVWVGRNNGSVLRWRGGRWDSLTVEGDRIQGQVTSLHADLSGGDTRAVYLAARGGRLTRLAFGAATAVNLPGRAVRDYVTDVMQVPGDTTSGRAMFGTVGAGVIEVDTMGRVRVIGDPASIFMASTVRAYWGPLSRRAVNAGGTDTSSVLVTSHLGLAWLQRGAWSLMPGSGERMSRPASRVQLLTGEQVLLSPVNDAILRWNDSTWVPEPSLAIPNAFTVYSTRTAGTPTILVLAMSGVHTITSRGARFDSLLPIDPTITSWTRRVCELPRPNGTLIFVAGDAGAIGWRPRDDTGAWRPLPAAFLNAMSTRGRTGLECGDNGHVYFGTASGLLIGDVTDANPERWSVRAMLGREDGLPSNEVTTIGRPFRNRLWVGTEFGPAIVDLARVRLAAPVPLSVRVLDDPSAPALSDGAEIPSSHDQLRVDVWLDTYHRESDSRFLIEWTREELWGTRRPRGTVTADTSWSEVSTRFITGIAPGSYRLRVRARDYAGRETTPVEWRLTIRPPWWRSWPAILAYVLFAVTLLWSLYRWRVSVLKSGTAQLVESEKRLRASESMFRALFDHALDAHLLVSSNRVVGANAVAERLFGVPASEGLLDRPLDSLLPREALCEPTPLPQELSIVRGDLQVPVQLSVTAIAREQGDLRHLVLRDLTEVRAAERARERMESHLRERQRLEALGTLAGGVAHDFNNLLGVIRGNAELADLAADDATSTREHLGSIVDASDRARDLVRQILTFSRSPLPLQARVDLSELLLSLQPLLRRMIPSSVQIVIDGTDTPHVVQGDPTQLQQIVINLASNAEYAMRAHGAGVLHMELNALVAPDDGPPPTGPVVQLTVRDSGVGMSREVRDRVFEPFFTTKPTGEGTGLGLAVLHGVVVAHGGLVQLESTPEVGTTIRILLPAAPLLPGLEEATSRPLARALSERSVHAGRRVIVVDDEAAVARVFERSLLRVGYLVRVFSDPNAALEAIRRAPDAVDLLLTDQTMPGLTGDALAEAVHQLIPSLPVLILTGFSHRLTTERALEVGAIDVLQKPIELEALTRAVDAALTKSPRQPDVPPQVPDSAIVS